MNFIYRFWMNWRLHNFKGAKKSINESSHITQELRSSMIKGVSEIKTPPLIKEQKFSPKDIINTLPRHTSKKWKKRKLKDINKIIVHQSMSEGTVKGVNHYHITPSPCNHISEKGTPHICYHYVISADKFGTVYQCNDLEDIVWGCRGQNFSGIQILVIGNFDGVNYHPKPIRKPTFKQLRSLEKLIKYLYGINKEWKLYGHCDFGKLACPGQVLSLALETYND